jgi:hypothetical protein
MLLSRILILDDIRLLMSKVVYEPSLSSVDELIHPNSGKITRRNHIACAMLVWVRLTQLAQGMQTNTYQLKQGLLDAYMRKQLRNPSISIRSA